MHNALSFAKYFQCFLKLLFTKLSTVTPFPLTLFLSLKHTGLSHLRISVCTALELLYQECCAPQTLCRVGFSHFKSQPLSITTSVSSSLVLPNPLPQYFYAFLSRNFIYLNNSFINCLLLPQVCKLHEGLQFINHSHYAWKIQQVFSGVGRGKLTN